MVAVAWLLNLDANDELADPNRTTRSRALEARLPELAARTGLIEPGDVLLTSASQRADGLSGRAWMPTPAAQAALVEAGAIVGAAPSLEVLRAVNRRAFAGAIAALPGGRLVATLDDVSACVREPTRTGKWLLKRPFAFGGRGRKAVRVGELDPTSRAWVATSLRREPELWIEPFVELVRDVAMHGFLDPSGTLTLGAPTVQRCDDLGIWRASELADPGEAASDDADRLEAATRVTAAALTREGYFGPFGIDGFRYVGDDGAPALHAPSDVNARYTMGYAVGMEGRRADRG